MGVISDIQGSKRKKSHSVSVQTIVCDCQTQGSCSIKERREKREVIYDSQVFSKKHPHVVGATNAELNSRILGQLRMNPTNVFFGNDERFWIRSRWWGLMSLLAFMLTVNSWIEKNKQKQNKLQRVRLCIFCSFHFCTVLCGCCRQGCCFQHICSALDVGKIVTASEALCLYCLLLFVGYACVICLTSSTAAYSLQVWRWELLCCPFFGTNRSTDQRQVLTVNWVILQKLWGSDWRPWHQLVVLLSSGDFCVSLGTSRTSFKRSFQMGI